MKTEWSRYFWKKTCAWLIPVLTPAFISTLIAAVFLWSHLSRTGHLELFYESMSLSSFFSYLFFFAGLSIVAFCLLFFMPSIMAGLFILSAGEDGEQRKKLNENNIRIVIFTALISVLVIFGYFLISLLTGRETEQNVYIQMLIIFATSIILTLAYNRTITSARIAQEDTRKRVKIILSAHLLQPLLIACAACIYVFPLQVFIHNLEFPDGTSELRQIGTVITLSMFVIIFSFIPGVLYFRLREQSSLLRMVMIISSIMAAILLVISVFVHTVPALILTMFLRISGVMDLTPRIYGAPAAAYPEEYFSGDGWHGTLSKDGKFYLLEAVELYSLGQIRLLCPPEVATVYRKSLKFQVLDAGYDEKLRDQLQQSASHCRRVDGRDLLMMGKLPVAESSARQ